ncbi:hypothetical protein [Arthrobacter sp. ISL-72]|uniref:hypothetical protein n=1 Tax=Arthrobacter sp. ISL-72 TaxID=2819114 RepID=UPI001BE8D245|nr:hypothetical protein [Arthrobacter sp. ISL-72]MBT2595870.1 hypothetical protein [Arthrobacter sp. ISL-72]
MNPSGRSADEVALVRLPAVEGVEGTLLTLERADGAFDVGVEAGDLDRRAFNYKGIVDFLGVPGGQPASIGVGKREGPTERRVEGAELSSGDRSDRSVRGRAFDSLTCCRWVWNLRARPGVRW